MSDSLCLNSGGKHGVLLYISNIPIGPIPTDCVNFIFKSNFCAKKPNFQLLLRNLRLERIEFPPCFDIINNMFHLALIMNCANEFFPLKGKEIRFNFIAFDLFQRQSSFVSVFIAHFILHSFAEIGISEIKRNSKYSKKKLLYAR